MYPNSALVRTSEDLVPCNSEAADALTAAVEAAMLMQDTPCDAEVISAAEVVGQGHRFGLIVDWTADSSVLATVMENDSFPTLREDRTYILFGLASRASLGVSLAEHMIRQGARNIVMTSRRPSISAEWIEHCARMGVRIEAKAK